MLGIAPISTLPISTLPSTTPAVSNNVIRMTAGNPLTPWGYWQKDEARREDIAQRIPFIPQTKLAAWRANAENRQRDGPVEFRRVSDNGWDQFRLYWIAPVSATPFFVGQPGPTPWAYWPADEAKREDMAQRRPFFPQRILNPVFYFATRQQDGPVEFRRVSDNGWDTFRLYWQQPVSTTPFFLYQPAAHVWDYWPKDEAVRERIDAFRFFVTQNGLKLWWASQAEQRQQQGPIEFRRVSDNGWDVFRLYWVQPAPPATGEFAYTFIGV